jgi:hypothetical protein
MAALAMAATLLGTLPVVLSAQPGNGHGFQTGHGPYFDPSTVITVSGELAASGGEWVPWGHGNHTGGGLHFELRADGGETYELMLAPAWFLEENGLALVVGERVTVKGSTVEPYGAAPGDHGHGHGGGPGGGPPADDDFLIATAISAGGSALELRDADGYPLWRGGPGFGMPWFDADSLVTLDGTLTSELGFWSAWGHGNHTGNGMHYRFEGDGGELFYAMLAPWWFLEDHGLALESGMAVTLTGSVVEPYWPRHDDADYLVVTEIVAGDTRVTLRDEYGYPQWHGTGWHYFSPAYDGVSTATIRGHVVRSQVRSHGRDFDHGYELVVRAGGSRYVVYVAPQWHVEQRHFSVSGGQRIEIRGSVVRDVLGRKAVVARDVMADGRSWRFRNARGNPVWMSGAF